jgi:hypothetical protein
MERVKGIVWPNALDLLTADLIAIASLFAQARRAGLWLRKFWDEVEKCGFRN